MDRFRITFKSDDCAEKYEYVMPTETHYNDAKEELYRLVRWNTESGRKGYAMLDIVTYSEEEKNVLSVTNTFEKIII